MKKALSILLALVLFVGVFAGCGSKEEAAEPEVATEAAPAVEAAPAAEEASATEVTWADYIDWLATTFGADCPDPDDYRANLEKATCWEEVDTSAGPWDKILGEDYFNASTWDEFVAAGGVGTYNADYSDDSASKEPSTEPAA